MLIWFHADVTGTGDILNLGLVREDARTLYLENADADLSNGSAWLREHVIGNLTGPRVAPEDMASSIRTFAGPKPSFSAYFAPESWTALTGLMARCGGAPADWPRDCEDVQRDGVILRCGPFPEPAAPLRTALDKAFWSRRCSEWLSNRQYERDNSIVDRYLNA